MSESEPASKAQRGSVKESVSERRVSESESERETESARTHTNERAKERGGRREERAVARVCMRCAAKGAK